MNDPSDPAHPTEPAASAEIRPTRWAEPVNDTPATRAGDWRDRAGARQAIDTGALVWGAILIAVGTWFFLDQTLGLDMPDVAWGDLWPVLLLVIGGAVILQGLRRRPS
jgi:hypothetical protein